jgi:hypothetical protein
VTTTTKGTIPEEIPLITQEEAINEINFNPFNDNIIAAASADGAARYYLPFFLTHTLYLLETFFRHILILLLLLTSLLFCSFFLLTIQE